MTHERLRVLERQHAQGDPVARLLVLEELRRLERPLVDPRSGLELVYVPGGEVDCGRCHHGAYPITTALYVDGDPKTCSRCQSTGRLRIAPFYLGRFPVTWREYAERVGQHVPLAGDIDGYELHPVVSVSCLEALSFCVWSGLRLPREVEWRWAALGTEFPGEAPLCPRCGGDGRTADRMELCPECIPHGGRHVRRFPWGNEAPSRERCVFASPETTHPRCEACGGIGSVSTGYLISRPRQPCEECGGSGREPGWPGRTKAVTVNGEPARPLGASWCGALDMAGNVWEWTSEGGQWGGSFRSTWWPREGLGPRASEHLHLAEDVGFRVALSVMP